MKIMLSGAAVLCAAAILNLNAQAQTQRTNVHMVAMPSEEPEKTELKVNSSTPILTTYAHSPRAVKLLDDITVGGTASEVTFPKGSVLFGRFDDAAWSYCGIAGLDTSSRVITETVGAIATAGISLLALGEEKNKINCLFDENNDGVFDSAWSGGNAVDTAFIAYTLYKSNMSTSGAYKRIPFTEGPTMPIEIIWEKSKSSGILNFKTIAGGQSMPKKSIPIPAAGADPVELKHFGATFEIIAYDAQTDQLTYRILEKAPRQYFRIPASLTITTSYVYY